MQKIVSLLILLILAVPAHARELMQGKNLWTIGYDFGVSWAEPSGPSWKKALNRSKIAQELYIADRFSDNWGFEIGYFWSDRKPKHFNIQAGEEAFGAIATVDSNTTAKIRYSNTYFDLYAFYPITKYVEAMAGIGIGYARPSVDFFHNYGADAVTLAMDGIREGTSATGRANIGFQALCTKRFGIRMLFRFETLNNVRVRGTIAPFEKFPWNNSYAVLLGIYWNFDAYG